MKNILTSFTLLFVSASLFGQIYIADPVKAYSYKKTAYITKTDGEEIEGRLRKVKTKKGLIERITIKLENDEKIEIEAADIKTVYLPQNAFDKFNQSYENAFDATRIDEENMQMNSELLKDGYAYFEKSNTQIRKKKQGVVLLQLLNPTTCQKIKIYHDPYATETMAPSVGGIKVAGGIAKSYFVKIGDKKAFRIKKKGYKDVINKLYGKCAALKKQFKKMKWSDFGEHVSVYTENCAE